MDQAKAMAADLDGKLNEAVGMDSDGKPLKPKETAPKETVSPTPGGTTTAAKTAAPAVTKITSDDGDDAWDDDFDFDDDMGDDKSPTETDPKSAPELVAAKAIPVKKKEEEPIIKAKPAIPEKPKAKPIVQAEATPQTKISEKTKADVASAKPTNEVVTPTAPTASETPGTMKTQFFTPAQAATSTSAFFGSMPTPFMEAINPVETPQTATSLSAPNKVESNDGGWNEDDDLGIEAEDTQKTEETITPKEDSKNPTATAAPATAKEETKSPDATPKASPTTAKDETKKASSSPIATAVESKAPSVLTTKEPTPATTKPETEDGLFSNFSNLAKSADSFLTAAVTEGETKKTEEVKETNKVKKKVDPAAAPAKITEPQPDAPESEPSTTPKETVEPETAAPTEEPSKPKAEPSKESPKPKVGITPKENPKPKTQATVFTQGGGLFSNLTSLAKTADSMLTKAVEQSADGAVESSEPIDSGGWDEGNNDDFFDDDDVDKDDDNKPAAIATVDLNATAVTEAKDKTEESASYVKVSPSSSISTPEVLPKEPSQQAETQKESSEQTVPEAKPTAPSASNTTAPTVAANIEDDPRFQKLQESLRLREEQLIDKGRQLNELQLMLETRDEQYKKKLQDTKEEAKKRIGRAKERCEAAEAKLKLKSAGDSDDMKKKQSIIDELMEEGQALAQKQSVMERAVRDAKAETWSLKEDLEKEMNEKAQALNKIAELETQCKTLKESLSSARKGESQAGKLENDLLSSRADAEEKANKILSLQQRMKELVAESKELKQEVDNTRKSAAHEAQQEQTSMRKEHNDLISDLEHKLRTTEREAGVREDALRREVTEIRKRWEDAVRRADALSMDIQSSTAPLLRQLESMERQNRMRSSNAAELESRLRSDLEEATIENERMSKQSSDFKSKVSKLERTIKNLEQELSEAQSNLEEKAKDLQDLQLKEKRLLDQAETRQTEFERVEKLANEGVARVRSEMSQTVLDSEERYRGQIDKLQAELKVENEKRVQLETQVNSLLESTSEGILAPPPSLAIRRESKPKKLHKAEGQAEILAGALGLGDSDDSDSDDENENELFDADGKDQTSGGGLQSYAAIDQLSSKLKSAEVELKSMKQALKESNEVRQSLIEELAEARHAKEKLPLFEARVEELTRENREMQQEIAGLTEDIADVKDLYRNQLNVLLEEKTSEAPKVDSATPETPSNKTPNASQTPQSNRKETTEASTPVFMVRQTF